MKTSPKKLLISVTISLLSSLLFYAIKDTDFLEHFENKLLDQRFNYSSQHVRANDHIAVILVDDASMEALSGVLGRWPWPRQIWSEVIQFLRDMGAKKILFDILFTEYQRPKNQDGQLDENDSSLVESTSLDSSVVHAMQLVHDHEDEVNKALLNKELPSWFREKFSLKDITLGESMETTANKFYLPFTELAQYSSILGVVEFAPDADGIYRRTSLIRPYQGAWFPTLSMAALLDPQIPSKVSLDEKAGELRWESHRIPLYHEGQKYLINMKKEFNTYSMSGVLATIQALNKGEMEKIFLDQKDFKDKTIFIGVSAVGGNDLKPTALGPKTPGVFLHASILSNILDGDYLKDINPLFILLATFLVTLLSLLGIFHLSQVWLQLAPFAFTTGLYVLASFWLFDHHRILLPLVYPLGALSLALATSYIYISFTEGKEKRKVRQMLSQYVSPVVLREVMDKKDGLTAEVGTKENLTILFSDVRSFTSFSEKHPPEQVVEMLNYYLNEMVDIVFKYEGTLDKFVGDAIMSFWGAPLKSADHAVKATAASLEMIERLKEINRHFREKGYPEFSIGIGLHSGDVILGNIGSVKKLDYTIIGDNVNLASRMEGLTKSYYSQLLISETTYSELKGTHPCKLMDVVRVKGKEKPIAIYAPLLKGEDEALVGLYQAAFDLYLQGSFQQAKDAYQAILPREDNKAHFEYLQMMIERCENSLAHPPGKDWDGVFTMKSK